MRRRRRQPLAKDGARDQRRLDFRRLMLIHRGEDVAGMQGIAADPVRPAGCGDVLADVEDGAFRGLIGVGVRRARRFQGSRATARCGDIGGVGP
jgi:hypothetical protein